MRQIVVTVREAGQRADKLLGKYLDRAPKSFLYKMMRKKNITLNGKKMQGNEFLQSGDELKLFLAEETVEKFQSEKGKRPLPAASGKPPFAILYEDSHILLLNKPAGMLSQKARPEDLSAVEYLIAYLLGSGAMTEEDLTRFHPSVCNRLDRNTSGILAAGKTQAGLKTLSGLLRERTVHKYYLCIVKGRLAGAGRLEDYLVKEECANQVRILPAPFGRRGNPGIRCGSGQMADTGYSGMEPSAKAGGGGVSRAGKGPNTGRPPSTESWTQSEEEAAKPIVTEYRSLCCANGLTLLEVLLVTGRSHQIRAHLASIGHPILGDPKYGDPSLNRRAREEYGITCQLLHAWRLEFGGVEGPLSYLSGQAFYAEPPEIYRRVMPGAWEVSGFEDPVTHT